MSLIVVAIGIDHRYLDAVDHTDGVDPRLSIIEPIIVPLHGGTVKDAFRIVEGDSVPFSVDRIFFLGPT
jgi:hypothetical protein